MLIKRSNRETNYCLPVIIVKSRIKVNWYYDNEYMLFSAYNQLKKINIGIKPLTPIVY